MKDEIEIDGVTYIKKKCVEPLQTKDMRYVLARSDVAGVFAGYINMNSRDYRGIVMYKARKVLFLAGTQMSHLAMDGTKYPARFEFKREENIEIILVQVAEIILCTQEAEDSIRKAEAWGEEQPNI